MTVLWWKLMMTFLIPFMICAQLIRKDMINKNKPDWLKAIYVITTFSSGACLYICLMGWIWSW